MHPLHKQTQADRDWIIGLVPLLPPGFPDGQNFSFPSAIDPNYEPSPGSIPLLILATILFNTTSTIVLLRFWLRWGVKFGMDDILMIPAFISYSLFSVVNLCGATLTGFGYHLYDLSRADIRSYYIIEYLHTILWSTTLYLTRVSILHLLIRLTPASSQKSRVYLYTVITVSYTYVFFNLFILSFECHPLYATFDLEERLKGQCIGGMNVYLYNVLCAGHITLDLLTIVPPMIVIARMTMVRSKKINLFLLVAFGYITIVCTIVRMFVYFRRYITHWDYTYNAIPVGLFGCLEVSIAVTIASLPAINSYIRNRVVEVYNKVNSSSLWSHGSYPQNAQIPDNIGKVYDRASRRPRSLLQDSCLNTTVNDDTGIRLETYIEIASLHSANNGTGGEKGEEKVTSIVSTREDANV